MGPSGTYREEGEDMNMYMYVLSMHASTKKATLVSTKVRQSMMLLISFPPTLVEAIKMFYYVAALHINRLCKNYSMKDTLIHIIPSAIIVAEQHR